MKYSALLEWAAEPVADDNKDFVDQWFSQFGASEELEKLTIWLAKSFVSGEVKYDIADI